MLEENILNVNVFHLRGRHLIWIVRFHFKDSNDLIYLCTCKKLKLWHHEDRPGSRANKAVALLNMVNVIICLYYYDVIMSLTRSLVFKQFRRDCIIVWLAKSLFYIMKSKERLQYRYFGFKNGGPDMLLPLKPTG